MDRERPEFELQLALDHHYDKLSGHRDGPETLCGGGVEVPIYVIEDAIERLKRYETIVSNLTNVGNYLWSENLRKYGERKINKKETPWGVYRQDTYLRMCSFVNEIREEEVEMEDAFVELALSMARQETGDSSGLAQYLEKEDSLFDQLEMGE